MISTSLAPWHKHINHRGTQDFLVRDLEFDDSMGAMAIEGGVHMGQRIRFMVRDKEGAMQDLTNHALAFKHRQRQVLFHAIIAHSSS